MLPEYNGMRLMMDRLTDDIVNTALDRCHYESISTETARRACYQWLSHASVWDSELEQFHKEGCSSICTQSEEFEALEAIQAVSNEIEAILIAEDTKAYQEAFIRPEAVSAALSRCEIEVAPEPMSILVAAYMVCGGPGFQENYKCELGSLKITPEDVARVASILMW